MQRQVPEYLAVLLAVVICGPALRGEENPQVAKTTPADAKKDKATATASEAARGEITVSWKGGKLLFPETGGKEAGLRLRCTGSVIIEGKGVTAKAPELDVTIEEKEGMVKAADFKASNLSLRCSGCVMIEWKGFIVEAADLHYDAEKDLLTLSAGGMRRPSSCTLRSKNNDGTYSILIADQISLSPFSNTVNCVGVREYKAADTQPTSPGPIGVYVQPTTYAPRMPGTAPSAILGPSTTTYPPPR